MHAVYLFRVVKLIINYIFTKLNTLLIEKKVLEALLRGNPPGDREVIPLNKGGDRGLSRCVRHRGGEKID